jgi:hypothetical protein
MAKNESGNEDNHETRKEHHKVGDGVPVESVVSC